MKSTITLLTAMLLLASPAFADGGSDGTKGGGDARSCLGRTRLAEFVESERSDVELLPYLYARQSVKSIIEATLSFVRATNPTQADEIAASLAQLHFEHVEKTLPKLKGDRFKAGFLCRKKQLAVQDLNSGIVLIDHRIFRRMPTLEQAFLYIHEALVRIEFLRTGNPVSDTRRVRDQVRTIFETRGFHPHLIRTLILPPQADTYVDLVEFYESVIIEAIRIANDRAWSASSETFESLEERFRYPLGYRDLEDQFFARMPGLDYKAEAQDYFAEYLPMIFALSGACPTIPKSLKWRQLRVGYGEVFLHYALRVGSQLCPILKK